MKKSTPAAKSLYKNLCFIGLINLLHLMFPFFIIPKFLQNRSYNKQQKRNAIFLLRGRCSHDTIVPLL